MSVCQWPGVDCKRPAIWRYENVSGTVRTLCEYHRNGISLGLFERISEAKK